jgi:hypothetical protein
METNPKRMMIRMIRYHISTSWVSFVIGEPVWLAGHNRHLA